MEYGPWSRAAGGRYGLAVVNMIHYLLWFRPACKKSLEIREVSGSRTDH